jgi:hypothetical protein
MSEVNKIANYNQMMSWLTRPSVPKTETRQNFYAGSSLEQFGSKIKDLHLKGTSSADINRILKFKNDKTTTIDSFIKSMISGEAPIKINVDELSKKPDIRGTNISGKPGQRKEDLKKYISDFEKKEGRLPSKAELRAANFDLTTTINPAIESGDIKVLPEDVTRSQGGYKRTNEELRLLADDQKVLDIFREGNPSLKDLKTIKKVIGPVSDKVAGKRIIQLANIFANTGAEELRELNIKPKFKKNALKIIDSAAFSDYLRDAYEELIGKSVGEKSIKKIKQEIRGSDLYKQSDLSKFYNIDELLGATSSVTKGTTPYGIFGQVIEGGINRQEKFQWDAEKSKLELKLQKTIKEFGKNSKEANAIKKEFNTKAKEAEEAINYGKATGAKKVIIPRVSFNSPNFTISNFKDFNKTYKKAFMDNFKEKGYSFEIPKNIRTIPQLRDDIKNPKSSTYKSLINSLKKGFNEYDEKKLFQKLKDATPESIKKNLKFIPRIASLEDDFTGPGGYPLTAGLDSNIGIKPMEEEQESFVERNPLTTAAAGTAATTGVLTGSKLLESDPLKKPRRYAKQIAKIPLKAGIKLIGSPTTAGLFAYDTIKENLAEGESLPRAIIDKEVGVEFLYPEIAKQVVGKSASSAKGILASLGRFALNPIGKAARVLTPAGATLTAAGLAKDYYDFVQRDLAEKEADPEAYKAKQDEQMGISAADGGLITLRKNFADGPEDPKKRKFMKIMGGLASIPLLGRFIDIGTTAPKVAEVVKRTAEGIPDFITDLIAKVKLKAAEKGTKYFTGNRADEFADVYKADNYVVTEQGNKTIIREIDQDGDMLYNRRRDLH